MNRHALVIGGGLAGMLAVRALLGHAESVTVLERDQFPAGPELRKGLPQARHLHVLVSGGVRAMSALLPGIDAALAEAGAHRLEIPRDLLTRTPAGWWRRYDEGRQALISCSRPLLDHLVRDLTLRHTGGTRVDVQQATEVTGLLGTAGQVTGVRVVRRAEDRAEHTLHADLVVDASGRTSGAPDWLAALGRPAPADEVLDVGLAYATRRIRFDGIPDPVGIHVQPVAGVPRGGVVLPVEGGEWIATLYGFRGHHPPIDETGFLTFAGTLADPHVHRLISAAQPRSPIRGFQNTANRRRRFELPGGVPEGFVALGDAACTVNPIYSHGMSVAALGALALRVR